MDTLTYRVGYPGSSSSDTTQTMSAEKIMNVRCTRRADARGRRHARGTIALLGIRDRRVAQVDLFGRQVVGMREELQCNGPWG